MHLYLVRHGESYSNLDHDKVTRPEEYDRGLTPRGEAQAQAVAAWLAKKVGKPDVLMASSMQRTVETAGFIGQALGIEAVLDHRLREMSTCYPDHSPIPPDRLPMRWREFSLGEEAFRPIGTNRFDEPTESFAHVKVRAGMWLEDMIEKNPSKTVIAVMHGGIGSAITDIIMNVGPYRRCDLMTDFTAVSYFEHRGEKESIPWYLHYLLMNAHLDGVDEGLKL